MRLFVDMDGTLNHFQPVEHIEELYEEGYFTRAIPYHEVIEAVRWLIENTEIDIYILSAIPDGSEIAEGEKDWWLDTHLPEINYDRRIYVDCGESKAEVIEKMFGSIREDDFLLDDYSKNLHGWKAAGGTGIKLMTGINGKNGTWKDTMIERIGEKELWGRLYVLLRRLQLGRISQEFSAAR